MRCMALFVVGCVVGRVAVSRTILVKLYLLLASFVPLHFRAAAPEVRSGLSLDGPLCAVQTWVSAFILSLQYFIQLESSGILALLGV